MVPKKSTKSDSGDRLGFFKSVRNRYATLNKNAVEVPRPVAEALKSILGPMGAPLAFALAYYDVKEKRSIKEDLNLTRNDIKLISEKVGINHNWLESLNKTSSQISRRLEELEVDVESLISDQERQDLQLEALTLRVEVLEVAQFDEKDQEPPEPPAIDKDSVGPGESRFTLMVTDYILQCSKSLLEEDYETLGVFADNGLSIVQKKIRTSSVRTALLSHLYAYAGDASYHQNDFLEAENQYKMSLDNAITSKLQRLYLRAVGSIGISLARQGRLEESVVFFDQSLKISPNLQWSLYNKGVALAKLGRHKEAVECFLEIVEKDSRNWSAWLNLGSAYGQLTDTKRELDSYEKATNINPDSYVAWANKGAVLARTGNFFDALKCIDQAINLNDMQGLIWQNQGIVLTLAGHLDEALGSFDQALRIDPKLANAWFGKGFALKDLGRYEESDKCVDVALNLEPNHVDFLHLKGFISAELGELDGALIYYDKALNLNGQDELIWLNKGVALGKQGKGIEAIRCFDMLLNINPDSAIGWYNKGVSLGALGEYDKAEEALGKAKRFAVSNGDDELEKRIIDALRLGRLLRSRG